MKPLALTLLAVTVFCGSASAQTDEDILRFSRYNYGFGTARSAAMGGAFASLGADLSSAVINPAGLGMYRRSEISISPSFTSANTESTNRDVLGNFKSKADKSRFAINNWGAAFNVYNGSSGLTSMTLGFSYNKMIDFNSTTSVIGRSSSSMIDAFGIQMAGSGIVPKKDSPLGFGYDFGLWGAIMAYNTSLLDYDYDNNEYFTKNLFDPDNAVFGSRFRKMTTGSTGQYDLSAGFNISNKVYLGLGFGIQDITYKETASYGETPENNKNYGLNNFNYTQQLRQDASAWNFKFGAIIRPVDELRIGLAIHTPTYISVDEYYNADMTAVYNDFPQTNDYVIAGDPNRYNLQTPARFIGGLSYTFGGMAIVSVDYERVWYNKMKMFWDDWNEEDLEITDVVAAAYKPANNIRAGLEVVATDNVFVRLGYAYYDSMYSNESMKDYGKTSNYSGGLGYRTGNWSLDVAYIYMQTKDAPAQIYHQSIGDFTAQSGIFTAERFRHNVTLTASVRF